MSNKTIRRILIVILIIIVVINSCIAFLLCFNGGYVLKIDDKNRVEVEGLLKNVFPNENINNIKAVSWHSSIPDPIVTIHYTSGKNITREPNDKDFWLLDYIRKNGFSDEEFGKTLFNISKTIIVGIIIFEIIIYFHHHKVDIEKGNNLTDMEKSYDTESQKCNKRNK